MSTKQLYTTGMAVGLQELEGLTFDISKPYIFCRLCGAIRQTNLDRNAVSQEKLLDSLLARREWSLKHARIHPEHQHKSLERSKRFLTPEAAHRLAAFGIVDLVGLSIDDEMIDAYALSKSVPTDDAEG